MVLPAAAETITFVADEWPPFNIVPDKQPEGYMLDIAREVFKAHGIDVVYTVVPWQRALEGTRLGQYTAAIGPTREEAPYLVFPREELSLNRYSFWVKKGNPWRFTGNKSLQSVSLGVVDGYDYRPWLNAYIKNNKKNPKKIQSVNGSKAVEMNIRKLAAGRTDAMVENESTVIYMAKKINMTESIQFAGYDKEAARCYIGFSPAISHSQKYARMLSEGIIRLRNSGRLTQILAVYGLKDWKE
jgi:polar amino acid transport system substrate-binding protein